MGPFGGDIQRDRSAAGEGGRDGEEEREPEGDAEAEGCFNVVEWALRLRAPGEGERGGGRPANDARRRGGAGPDVDDELLDGGRVAEGPDDPQGHAVAGSRGNLDADGPTIDRGAEGAAPSAAVAASAVASIAGDFGGDGELELGSLGEPGGGHLDAHAAAGSGRRAQGFGVDDLAERISIHARSVPDARRIAKRNPRGIATFVPGS